MLKERIYTIVLGIPLILSALYIGGIYYLTLLIIISVLALKEYFNFIVIKSYKPSFFLGYASVILFFLLLHFNTFYFALVFLAIVFLLLFIRSIIQFPRYNILESALTFWGIMYIVLLFGSLFMLRQLPDGLGLSIFIFVTIWANDIGAYVIGISIGKRPLAPKISPRKSLEGSVGGILISIGTLIIIDFILPYLFVFSVTQIIIWGGFIALLGQLGDLTESSLKREFGLKDSGKLIPGHGGILDRFDSFIYSAPLFLFFSYFCT